MRRCGVYVFALKEIEIFAASGGFNAQFWQSTVFNVGTTALTIAGGGLLAKTATKGSFVPLASKFGSVKFYQGLPTAACAEIQACASPHWPPW